jgi:hypothetical protein
MNLSTLEEDRLRARGEAGFNPVVYTFGNIRVLEVRECRISWESIGSDWIENQFYQLPPENVTLLRSVTYLVSDLCHQILNNGFGHCVAADIFFVKLGFLAVKSG